MKHSITDDIDVNVNVRIPSEFESLIDKVTESVILVIAASTAAHILKSFFKN